MLNLFCNNRSFIVNLYAVNPEVYYNPLIH